MNLLPKQCLYCKHYTMEYRPDIREYAEMKDDYKISFEWRMCTTLFLGCSKPTIEKEQRYDGLCEDFEWDC